MLREEEGGRGSALGANAVAHKHDFPSCLAAAVIRMPNEMHALA